MTGIICSVHTRLCSLGTSATSRRTSSPARTPISRRIRPASLPIHFGLMWPGLPGGPVSVKITLLSNEAPRTMSRPARSISAVWSTTAGGFPGPAVTARLSVFRASRTTPGPPVTSSRRTAGWFMSALALSMVGSATAVTRFAGPPDATMARLSSRTFSAETRFAFGWTLKTSELPAETIEIVLLMIVEVGLVVGVIAATTPKGANSVTIIPSSPVAASTSRSSGPGAFVDTIRFLTILSATRPRPVSAWAISASRSLCSSMEPRIAEMMALRPVRPTRRNSSNAAAAAPTASSIVAKMPSPSSPSPEEESPSAARRPAPGCAPASPSRLRTRSMMPWISCCVSVPLMSHPVGRSGWPRRRTMRLQPARSRPSLVELLLAADLPGVDDGHDHGVARPVPGRLRLARGAAGGHHHHLAHAGADRVRRHDERAGVRVVHVEIADHEELQALHRGLLAARDQGPGHASQKHVGLLPPSVPAAPRPPTATPGEPPGAVRVDRSVLRGLPELALGLLPPAERQDHVDVHVR